MHYIKGIKSEIAENKYLSEAIQDPFIQLRIQSSLEWYIRKAQKNKHYFYIFSMITIICPILSGVVNLIAVNEQLRIFASGIMGCSSITAAFLNLFNVNKKWMLYRNQAEGIKRMVSIYVTNGQTDKETFIEQLESFMGETHKSWMEYFHTSSNNQNNPCEALMKRPPEQAED